MCDSGDAVLERGAVASLDALAACQASNGQIPKYVDPEGQDADFWYLGCIDATLWWLIAVDHLRRAGCVAQRRWAPAVRRAIAWLQAQEHPHFRLLQQNEASDWADIMPRSGYVLYSNALWHDVKRRYGLEAIDATHHHFNHLFNPYQRDLPEYHRARLLRHYARRGRSDPGLYLSFVNFAFAGNEGDVFGNLLAVLCGLAPESTGHRIAHTIATAGADQPWPIRVTLHPLTPAHPLWRPYMARHRQNLVHQYHNGGLWPFVGGFWVLMLARLGLRDQAAQALQALARGQCAARLALHRMVPRPHARAARHGRAELECGDLSAGAARARRRRKPVVNDAASTQVCRCSFICGKGISISQRSNAAFSRRRYSRRTAHCSSGLTRKRERMITAESAHLLDAGDVDVVEDARAVGRVTAQLGRRPRASPSSRCRCRWRRRR